MSSPLPPRAEARVFSTLARALTDRVGGLDAAAAVTRVGRSQLGNYASLHDGQTMPVDVVADLEAVAGEPLITAELARRAGYLLVPLTPADDGPLAERMARLAAEVGQAFSAYAAAVADGHTTAEEEAHIARELTDIIAASQRALATLTARPGA